LQILHGCKHGMAIPSAIPAVLHRFRVVRRLLYVRIMKKTTRKAEQLQFVRNVIRQLTPTDLGQVNGGAKTLCTGTRSLVCCGVTNTECLTTE
jgi:hypothetical protein